MGTSIYTYFEGPQTYRKEGDTDLRVNRVHGYLDLHRNEGLKNAYPRAEIGVIDVTQLGQRSEFWGAILNPLSLLLLEFPPRRHHSIRAYL